MQIIELATKLQSVGLSEKQARVYVAALFLGPSAVQKIAEQAEINRATTYVILDELAAMGLVSESTEGKKTVFVAEPPQSIERYLDAQNKQISDKQDELKNILPSLKEVSRSSDGVETPVVRFYKGIEGLRSKTSIYARKAKPKSQVYGFSNFDEVLKEFPDILQSGPNLRQRKKISSKLMYSLSSGEIKSDKKILRETRKIDQPIAADINIYENAVVISTYKGKDSVGVAIESKDIASAMKQLFELAWKINNK